jgi:hypothetical protein
MMKRFFAPYSGVIVREGGRSSTPGHLDSTAEASDYWMPAFAGMTANKEEHS